VIAGGTARPIAFENADRDLVATDRPIEIARRRYSMMR
jgi:hypothetical protein